LALVCVAMSWYASGVLIGLYSNPGRPDPVALLDRGRILRRSAMPPSG